MKVILVEKEIRSCRECPYFEPEQAGKRGYVYLFKCKCKKLDTTVSDVVLHRQNEGDVVMWMFLERIYWDNCPLPEATV